MKKLIKLASRSTQDVMKRIGQICRSDQGRYLDNASGQWMVP
ncbi:hypothetical protein U3A58_10810 [Algoriphagus sp. C2-6-M1]|nr:hypothetical protein [Algoriphagus sp. C2-6-M1]MEB2780883.1 hypothetical protein [Algoriphagus sp. C2-6-M1]